MKYLFILLLIASVGCNSSKNLQQNSSNTVPQNVSLNGKLFTALFQQRAAEYRALCMQGYNIAKWNIDTYKPNTNKPLAIITDIDETVLDNSPYAVHQAYNGKEYEAATWYEWTDKSMADTMPGVGTLLQYIKAKGIEVFYITNREERERNSTLKNLQKYNLPNTDDAHFFPKINGSSKEARRIAVMEKYEVILLMGDNLADFSIVFDKKTELERKNNVDAYNAEFGKKFIVFPNANYGDWESSMYQYSYKFSQAQKDSIFKEKLINF